MRGVSEVNLPKAERAKALARAAGPAPSMASMSAPCSASTATSRSPARLLP